MLGWFGIRLFLTDTMYSYPDEDLVWPVGLQLGTSQVEVVVDLESNTGGMPLFVSAWS